MLCEKVVLKNTHAKKQIDFYDSYCEDDYCWGEDENGTEWEFYRYDY